MTAPEKPKRGSTTTILTAVLVILLVALFAVPGYIAGFYCETAHDYDSQDALAGYYSFPSGMGQRPCIGLQIFLTPAYLLTKISPPLRKFYLRQFYAVFGIYIHEAP